MNVKNIKKGFTLTELIIVIVIIGILAGVLIPTFINVVNKANKSADLSLIRNLNEALTLDRYDNGEHKHMTSALDAVEEYGFGVAKIDAKVSKNKILWDSKNDVFCYLVGDKLEYYPQSVSSENKINITNDDSDERHLLWIIDDNVPADSKYSVYYTGEESSVTVNNVGFDAGKSNVTDVKYNGDSGNDVIILTNSASTTLTIDDASTGTIYHYGEAGALNIIRCHTASYHENGKVAFAEIAKGRIVLESGSEIKHIHVNAKEDNSGNSLNEFDIIIIADNGAKALPEAITRDQVDVSEAKAVVTVESGSASETVYVYPYTDSESTKTGTTEQTTTQNTAIATDLGKLVLDNGSDAGEKAMSNNDKESAKTEVVNEAIESVEYAGVAVTKTGKPTQLMTLEAFRDAVNDGTDYAGYTVKLLGNVDLKDENWIPIGNNDHPFSGVFDGQGYTISNITVSLTTKDAGLFGVVRGLHNENLKTSWTDFWDESTSSFILGSDSETNFSTIIKNVTLRNVNISTTQDYSGGLVGYAIDTYFNNINVASGKVYAAKAKVGGVIGSSNGCSVLNNLVTGSELEVKGDKHTIGGIVGNIQRTYWDPDHKKLMDEDNTLYHAIIVENCTNNATVIWDKNGSHSGGVPIAGIIGNSGSINDNLTVVVYKCVNNGEIQANACSYASGIIGQSHTKVKIVYGCINNGNITAEAYDGSISNGGVAGITISGDASIIACINTGTLTNTQEGANAYEITSSIANIIIESSNFDNVTELQSEIQSRYNETCKAVVLKNVSVSNTEGTLTLPSSIETISSNTKVCDSIDLSGNIKGIYMVGLNQKVNVTRTIVFGGTNNNISVDGGITIGNIHLQGTNNSFVNNGTMQVLTYGVYNTQGNLTTINYGTMKGFGTVTGAYHMTFTNYGTISREDWHTFDIETDGSLIVHNYGTIHGKNGNPYALLLYGACDVTFYAHSGSIVEGGLAAYSKAHTVIIYADEGTTINGLPWSSVASKTYNVTVNQ